MKNIPAFSLFIFSLITLFIFFTQHLSFPAELTIDFEQLNQQVLALYQEGKFKEATPLAQKIFLVCRKELGLQDQKTLDSAANLASLFIAAGKYSAAEKLFIQIQQVTEKKYGREHLRTGINCNQLGRLYQILGRYDEAHSLYTRAYDIYRNSLKADHIEIATILNNLAALHATTGSYSKANSSYDQALSITEKKLGKNSLDVARILTNKATPLYYLGNFDKAISVLFRALDIQQKQLGTDHPEIADTLNSLGTLFSRIAAYEEAEKYLNRALVIRERVYGKNHPVVAENIFNIATLHYRTGFFKIAEQEYLRVLQIREKLLGINHPDVATSLNNLAALYDKLGLYEKAKTLYERAYAINKNVYGMEHVITAGSLNNLAIIYYNLGDFDKAKEYFDRCLHIKENILSPDHLGMATSYNNIGSFLYSHVNEFDEAERLFKKSIGIREKKLGPHHSKTKESWNNLGFLYLKHNLLNKAFKIFKTQESSKGLGKYYLQKGEHQKALLEFKHPDPQFSDLKRHQISVQIGLGLAYEGLKQYQNAKTHFKNAIKKIEEQWAALSPKDRGKFLDGSVGIGFKRLDAYEGMIRANYKEKSNGSSVMAFLYAEKVKSRNLLQMIAAKNIQNDQKIDSTIISDLRARQQKLWSTGNALAEITEKGSKVPFRFHQQAQNEYASAQNQYDTFFKKIQKNHSEFASLIAPVAPAPIKKIQALLGADTTLVEFYVADTDTYVWVIRSDSIRMERLAVKEDDLLSMVNDTLLPAYSCQLRSSRVVSFPPVIEIATVPTATLKNKRKQLIANAKKLYSALLAPIISSLTTKNLIIVPHGVLHKVPFSALHDGNRFIIDTFTISVAPSANVLQYISTKRNIDHGKLIGFANPITRQGALKFAEEEVTNIAQLFKNRTIHIQEKATESTVKDDTKNQDVIHFACHGEFNEKHPMQSALLLSSDTKNDGRLEVSEIFDLNLQDTNLVVLSACETAAATIQGGDDLIGLSRGFIYAGTPTLLATLWKVDDKSTEILMQDFYKNWRTKKMSKAAALRQAQLTLKTDKRFNHPFYWAPFVLIGDWK